MHSRRRLGLAGVMLAFLSVSNQAGRGQSGDESGLLWHFAAGG
jgi:hypothetical protein